MSLRTYLVTFHQDQEEPLRVNAGTFALTDGFFQFYDGDVLRAAVSAIRVLSILIVSEEPG